MENDPVAVHDEDDSGWKPLHYAAPISLSIAHYLVEDGYAHVDPVTSSNRGYTPLHIAAKHGKLETVYLLAPEAHAGANKSRRSDGVSYEGRFDIVCEQSNDRHGSQIIHV